MAFQPGRNAAILVNQYDLSSYFKDIEAAAKGEFADVTTFGPARTAHDKLATIKDGQLKASGFWDPVAGASDAVLAAALGGAAVNATYAPIGLAVGNPVKTCAALNVDYGVKQAATGVVENSVSIEADGGIDTGVSLHALTAETSTGQSASVDNGAASTNGGVGQVHITALSGTSPSLTPKVQHSVDNSVWVDLVAWGAFSAVGHSRSAVTGTVNRYLRGQWATGGTGPSATFHISFARR